MTPEECKEQIRVRYLDLKKRKIGNAECLIEQACREAANHNGVPGYWRNYLPKEMQE